MIIACDNSSWRKEKFANYKAKRKTDRDESPLDWGKFFGFLNGYAMKFLKKCLTLLFMSIALKPMM